MQRHIYNAIEFEKHFLKNICFFLLIRSVTILERCIVLDSLGAVLEILGAVLDFLAAVWLFWPKRLGNAII